MRALCPNCQHVSELTEPPVSDECRCPACGSTFRLGQGETGTMIHYVAPERSRHGATPPGDLYACGMLWYFMLAGTPPFAGASPEEIRAARNSGQALPLSRRVPGLPAGADAIYSKLTYKEPTLRYRNPAALMADLDLLENGVPTQAERELRGR